MRENGSIVRSINLLKRELFYAEWNDRPSRMQETSITEQSIRKLYQLSLRSSKSFVLIYETHIVVMKHGLRSSCFLIFISTGITAIMEPTEESILASEDPTSFNEAFTACLARKEFGTFECVNRGALSALQSLNHKDDLDFGNVHLERADGQSRQLLDWDYDPKDFGNIVKATTKLIERRSLKWNLDNLYPGLQLRAGPMLNGNGIMEFVINERATSFGDRQAGPGES